MGKQQKTIDMGFLPSDHMMVIHGDLNPDSVLDRLQAQRWEIGHYRRLYYFHGLLIVLAVTIAALLDIGRRNDIARLTHCQDVARAYIEGRATETDLRHAVLATTPAED